MNAADFTADIDRATEQVPEVAEEIVVGEAEAPLMSGEQQGQIGREAIFSAAERENLKSAEQELAHDREKLVNPDEFVGVESPLLDEEYRTDDDTDIRDELGQGIIPTAGKNMVKNQVTVATGAMAAVQEATKQKVLHPAELLEIRRMGMHAMLRTYSRRLGDRN